MRDRKSDIHRTLAQSETSRTLQTDEVVHHRDEDKANNVATNRVVVPRGQHTALHNTTRGLSRLRASLRMVREGRKLY